MNDNWVIWGLFIAVCFLIGLLSSAYEEVVSLRRRLRTATVAERRCRRVIHVFENEYPNVVNRFWTADFERYD